MPLTAGESLGQYEIRGLIGAGGMGEVYRARDTRLGRDVAIKVLPAALARDPDRLARLEREARVLASLNHPNIAAIYGLEDNAIVMELVEGPTLAERIQAAPLPLEEALTIARAIADALEAAHERGIVHRDLKPANIKAPRDGTVKVLDLGLATVLPGSDRDGTDPAISPTLAMDASPIDATQAGMILGTAAYMSPEQASGRKVDKRADIWAFGVVLWEMVTRMRLFQGETVSHTLADVLRAEIDFDKLPANTPAPIRELLKRCLDRDVKMRLRDIGEARVAIQKYLANPAAPSHAPGRRLTPWVFAGILFLAAAVFFSLWFLRHAPARLVSQFTIEAPSDTTFTNVYAATAVSPDGHSVVFSATASGGSGSRSLWLRPLDSLESRPLPGTDGANLPFWSPDSKSIAFLANGKLKRLDLQGGASMALCDITESLAAVGGTWSRDGVILVGGTAGLVRVPASGGEPVLLTKADASRRETGHGFPQFLPDGEHFLYMIQSGNAIVEGIYAASLDHPEQRVQILKTDTKAVYTQPILAGAGYLLWLREQTLLAQRFDAGRLRLQGDRVVVVQDVAVNAIRRAAFWVSDAGLLVYRTGAIGNSRMAWIGGDGKRAEQFLQSGGVVDFRLSPDGKRAAFGRQVSTGSQNLWLLEFSRGFVTRLTFDAKADYIPSWSPDGRQIAFSSDRSGIVQIYRKDADGGGREEQLTGDPNNKQLTDWSRDGKFLLYSEEDPKTELDLWALPLDGPRKPIPILRTPFIEDQGQFSPDGKWVAYQSNESGSAEVYVTTFPSSTGKWQISNHGGVWPRWRGDGKELFYLSPDRKMMAVTIRTSPASVQADTPRDLFAASLIGPAGPTTPPYDVTADGKRFLLLERTENRGGIPPLTVVVNWDAGLKK